MYLPVKYGLKGFSIHTYGKVACLADAEKDTS
jgi:hypothetical protein